MSSKVISLKGVNKSYWQGDSSINVLKGISLELNEGESLGLLGPSGCGKSTLLHIAGLLDRPDSGEVIVNGKDAGQLSDYRKTMIRRSEIGFIFQFHHLLPEFTALENVVLPQMIMGAAKSEARKRAEALLGDLGLAARMNHRPSQLSGGEQQRVAIARALANKPKIILADEPTGNLDPHTAGTVFNMFMDLVKNSKMALILVTHNTDLVKKLGKVMTIKDGILATR